MGMRTVYLIPKIYDHRLKTLAAENGFEESTDSFTELYNAVKDREIAIYYEYNFPTQGYLTAVLAEAQNRADDENGFYAAEGIKRQAALAVLKTELEKETFRLVNDLVSREMRSALGKIEYPQGERKETLIRELCGRWEKLPAGIFSRRDNRFFDTVLFQTKLGLRLGCSGGGSCSSCTHPTCGYRSA